MKPILLKGGRVIDPGRGVDAECDVRVRAGRIEAMGTTLAAADAEIIDCRSRLVLPGLIDTHAHVYQHVTGSFGLNADLCGVRSGVTTLVDQGGPSCMTLPGFRNYVAAAARSRVVAFLSAYLVGGLEGHYYASLYRPDCVDVDATVRAAEANLDLVRGIKAHAEMGGFARWGVEVMRAAAEIGRRARLPVAMKPGDVLAHPFSRHPGGFVGTNGALHPLVREAVARGLKIDVGHGSHFSFKMARIVLDAGILPDTLGADMHGHNTRTEEHAPAAGDAHLFAGRTRFSLVSAMTSMLALGVPLDRVVSMVTCNAARMIGMQDECGTLEVGRVADVSVLSDERGRWLLCDNDGTEVVAARRLEPLFCLRAGERIDATAPILPTLRAA